MIKGEEVEDVEEFVYLGVTVAKQGGGTRSIFQLEDLEHMEHWSEHINQTV